MLDLKFVRENVEKVKKGLAAKRAKVDLPELLELDKKRREILSKVEDLRGQQNAANDEISQLIKNKQDARKRIDAMKKIAKDINALEPGLKDLEQKIDAILLGIPNIAHSSVAIGGPEANKVARSWGTPKKFDPFDPASREAGLRVDPEQSRRVDFKPKTHIEIAESLDIIDFKRAAKIAGSNFILYKKDGARLERALLNFMLDLHTREHGYTEVFPPVLVNRASMTGTGQLPKMEEDMYRLKDEDLFLIPTAEVPVTNIHRDEVLDEKDLPIYYTAYTPCFRREAGSYGKDTKGLIRVHQFDKVELVKFVKPETSYDELEKLVANAEKVFQLLGLPYRVLALASGDLSFAAAKCYDIEVYAAGVDKWLECSSCSNFEDFQARRCGIRFKAKATKKSAFVHTLNGSGIALARAVVAILENYQTPGGDVLIPEVLRPYMGGKDKITK